MKLRFTDKFAFYKGVENKPFLEFQEGEEIKVLRSTEDDPHNYEGTVMFSAGESYTHKQNMHKHYWVEAKNGTTVWTTIHNLLLKGILEPVT